jgi:hypothetical protein
VTTPSVVRRDARRNTGFTATRPCALPIPRLPVDRGICCEGQGVGGDRRRSPGAMHSSSVPRLWVSRSRLVGSLESVVSRKPNPSLTVPSRTALATSVLDRYSLVRTVTLP